METGRAIVYCPWCIPWGFPIVFSSSMHRMQPWSSEHSIDLYGIRHWGAQYFSVNADGHLTIRLPGESVGSGTMQPDSVQAGAQTCEHTDTGVEVSLSDIVAGLRARGLDLPLVLRIENFLDHSISRLNQTFTRAIEETGYRNVYQGVYPIKVNQQSQVVDEIARFGDRFCHGLEAGSKAELLIALALLENRDSLIVCNGYKDSELIELALQAGRLGQRCLLVVESADEAELIIGRSQALGLRPMIGLRVKLNTRVEGHWSSDSGDRSLFGLNASEIISVVDLLKRVDMLDTLQMLHFHLGSQIPNIRNVRDGVREACRYYVELVAEGAPLGYLDLGGGLAVDYDGTRGRSGHSRNYSLKEYCVDIVETVRESLDHASVEHPVLVTESGRATVAYTSVLLFDVLGTTRFSPATVPTALPENAPPVVHWLYDLLDKVTVRSMQECYNDARYYRDQVQELFQRGQASLRMKSLADNIYFAVLQRVAECAAATDRLSDELDALPDKLADIYYCNFSVFQSLPDAWAINQVFPVVPLQRLDQKPDRLAVIADLTCDCDGKLDRFATTDGEARRLPVHSINANEDYLLGVFLVGAYQETLGDLHNLFGDTNVASVRINDDGSFDVVHELQGDTIADVLSYVEYEPDTLYRRLRDRAEKAVREGRITVNDRRQLLHSYSDSLRGYTYYEK